MSDPTQFQSKTCEKLGTIHDQITQTHRIMPQTIMCCHNDTYKHVQNGNVQWKSSKNGTAQWKSM